jgi:hypothetical protein
VSFSPARWVHVFKVATVTETVTGAAGR